MRSPLIALAVLAGATSALADVTVTQPWVRGTVAAQKATGAYMQLKADADTRLVEARSPVAGVVEVHEMAVVDNVMKMRKVAQGLAMAPGQTLELKPGSYHVMLMELKQQLTPGHDVPLTLVFEETASKKRFTKEIKAPVQALGGHAASMPHQH